MNVQPSFRLSLASLTALTLVACGGGGGGGGDRTLTVDYSYPQSTVQLWKPANIAIQTTGLEGNVPNCQILGGRLQAGLVLAPSGCAITGAPTEVGHFSATIRLTVAGFTGQVDKQITISVFGPPLRYELPANANFISAGSPFSVTPIETAFNVWTPQANETLTYSVASGALPEGLSLNVRTGEISGVLTSREDTDFRYTIGLVATSPLGTYTATSLSQSIRVAPGLRIAYPGLAGLNRVGFFNTNAPSFQYPTGRAATDYTFTNFRLALTSDPLPSGLTLDSNTGFIAGTPTQSGLFRWLVLADVTIAGQTGTISASPFELRILP